MSSSSSSQRGYGGGASTGAAALGHQRTSGGDFRRGGDPESAPLLVDHHLTSSSSNQPFRRHVGSMGDDIVSSDEDDSEEHIREANKKRTAMRLRRQLSLSNARTYPGGIESPYLFYLLLSLCILGAILLAHFLINTFLPAPSLPAMSISKEVFKDGLAKCDAIKRLSSANSRESMAAGGYHPEVRRRNPRWDVLRSKNLETSRALSSKVSELAANATSPRAFLFKHATMWDGIGGKFEDTDVAVAEGLIITIGQGLTATDVIAAARTRMLFGAKGGRDMLKEDEIVIVQLEGRYLTPGIVDQHSHVGTDQYPNLAGASDTNEVSSPANPQLRVQDGVSFLDPAFDIILSGGVTTSLILPGSGTLMGGEAVALKMLRPDSHLIDDMTLNRNMAADGADGKQWRWMKMACGENPKRVGQSLRYMPFSRLGSGWLYRKQFEQARELLRSQDAWCDAADRAVKLSGGIVSRAHSRVAASAPFPERLVDESLVALLRGDVRLQVHCYETHDIEMMIRNKKEFGFQITAFHHALEAHMVAPMLAKENISVAIFADHSYYKKEACEYFNLTAVDMRYTEMLTDGASTKSGKILHEAGVKVAYKSDHPVLNAQHLIFEAQKGAAYGLDPDAAFMAVTSVPADRLGAGWRVGRIAPGYDADLVVWDREPLSLGARPLQVYVDGVLGMDRMSEEDVKREEEKEDAVVEEMRVVNSGDRSAALSQSYTIANASRIFVDDDDVRKGSVVVEKGVISCIGPKCSSKGTVYDMMGGVVIPGLVAASTNLGLVEIAAEPSTQDGPSRMVDALLGQVRAVDGLHVGMDSKPISSSFLGGILHSISAPTAEGPVQGLSALFRTRGSTQSESVVKPVAAMHVHLGTTARSPLTPSVSSQFALLRSLLEATDAAELAAVTAAASSLDSSLAAFAATAGGNIWRDVATGALPLIVSVDEPSDIERVLTLRRSHPSMRLAIQGGAGAHLVADQLSALRVPVILNPARCVPSRWETRHCVVSGTRPSALGLLRKAGVNVVVTQTNDGVQRNLLWEAG
ncbi:hypothetical protein HK101_002214, partial [Irineochytrium annulatum]